MRAVIKAPGKGGGRQLILQPTWQRGRIKTITGKGKRDVGCLTCRYPTERKGGARARLQTEAGQEGRCIESGKQ
ncbi:hypothetical protein O3P69_010714 [Scylla paramamosain]|uniref:Uncharacterized protein n=1 Tax=Scylla paramamosain TaxID=85552 RepID=A0AAW0TEQ6_SCYPA